MCLACTARPARSQNETDGEGPIAFVSPQREATADGRFVPVDRILTDLTNRNGFSFIFDSRILRGRRVPSLDRERPPDEALEASLQSADLTLHKIAADTFAITKKVSVPSAALPVTALPVAGVKNAALIDAIVVTGVAGALKGGSRNVLEIDDDWLKAFAAQGPGEVIYDLPQSLASVTAANTALFGATAGLNLVDLRGLGPERSLVLVNGRRRTPTPGGNGTVIGVDLNSIAEPFLKRIEVVNQSAAVKLGPDSAAGAVNFVTRNDVGGVEVGGDYGVSQHGDAQERSLYGIIGGAHGQNMTASFGVNYVKFDGVLGADRPQTQTPFGFAVDGLQAYAPGAVFAPGFGGSPITPSGELSGVLTADGNFIPSALGPGATALTGDGGVEAFEGRLDQLYNWSEQQHAILPNERLLAVADASYEVSANIDLFASAQIGASRSDVRLAPVPASAMRGGDGVIGDGVAIAIDHPTIPEEIATFVAQSYDQDISALVVNRRYVELGPRRRVVDRRYNDVVLGLDMDVGDAELTAYYRYGRNIVDTEQRNRIDRSRLMVSLNPDACSKTAGCAPVDLFRSGGVNQTAADFVRADPLRRKLGVIEHEIVMRGNVRTEVMAGRRLILDAGVGARRTRLFDRNLTGDVAVIGSFTDPDFDASLTVADLHAALDFGVFDAASSPGEINLGLGYRVSAASRFGAAHNLEATLDWRPIPSVALFGAVHHGARPPNVTELFYSGSSTETFFIDPCGELNSDPSRTVAENCARTSPLGVGADFRQTKFLAEQSFFGNPDLRPEDVRRYTVGAEVFLHDSISAFPGALSLRAAWTGVRVDNALSNFDDPLTTCYESPGLSRACVRRQPAHRRKPDRARSGDRADSSRRIALAERPCSEVAWARPRRAICIRTE